MRLGEVESRFADIVWQNEPIKSRDLTIICEKELGWKRTTTYTVLKKLCNRGIFENEKGMVKAILSKEEFYGMEGEEFVNDAFHGSLPAFIAAFTKRKELSMEEIRQIQQIIEHSKGE